MKKKGKIRFFVVTALVLLLAYCTFFGVSFRYGDRVDPFIKSASEIRFGIDIRGGVDVTFAPAGGAAADETQMAAAQAVVENRLINLGITDYELYKDVNRSQLILRFPWKVGETEFNPETAIQELAATALLTFREGGERNAATGAPEGVTAENIILQGDDVANASAVFGPTANNSNGEYYVLLELNSEATAKFADATAKLAGQSGGSISIWLDDTMVSNATVSEAISGGNATITGTFTAETAKTLADTINAGSLPFALSAESYSNISPTLGSNSLRAMVIAGAAAFVLIAVFMAVCYRVPGGVAVISLLGHTSAMVALISGFFAVFSSFTLTLPGIAGIILSVGMGVDANVITSERIREELRSGKKLDAAIRAGFDRGIAPIVDGNVTVLIVAVMLMAAFGPSDAFFGKALGWLFFAFGPSTAGSIYSFGCTLFIGVALNMLFGVLCNRALLTSISKFKCLRSPGLYGGLKMGRVEPVEKPIRFVSGKARFFGLSGAVIVLIAAFTLLFGVQMDVQFRGGALLTYAYQGEADAAAVGRAAEEALGSAVNLQTGTNTATGVQTVTFTLPGTQTVGVEVLDKLSAALDAAFAGNRFEQLEVSNVDPVIGREFLAKCTVAVVFASLLILAYIGVRFRKIGGWRGGLTAVAALVHDLILVYGVFVVLGIPLGGNFIAALLTILGYSINDTVVIYDRIRENRLLYSRRKPFAEIANLSINQSLNRSLNTSITTITALGCVCIFSLVYGLDSIFTFAFPLAIGMVSGVYSSVCIAGPLWVMWERRRESRGSAGRKARAAAGETA